MKVSANHPGLLARLLSAIVAFTSLFYVWLHCFSRWACCLNPCFLSRTILCRRSVIGSSLLHVLRPGRRMGIARHQHFQLLGTAVGVSADADTAHLTGLQLCYAVVW